MCFFYALPKKKKEVVERFDGQLTLFDDTEVEGKYIIKGFDHDNSNFIVAGDNEIRVAKWGLIPHTTGYKFAEIIRKKSRNVNARSEEIFKTKSFKDPIDERRCLVPATGWYEYHYDDNGKVESDLLSFVPIVLFDCVQPGGDTFCRPVFVQV